MHGEGPSDALPLSAATRQIHALWDHIADFDAHETNAALGHLLRVLSDLTGTRNAFWLGAVRLGSDPDPDTTRPCHGPLHQKAMETRRSEEAPGLARSLD
jgi:hypothetical protein